MHPVRPGRRALGGRGQARLDEAAARRRGRYAQHPAKVGLTLAASNQPTQTAEPRPPPQWHCRCRALETPTRSKGNLLHELLAQAFDVKLPTTRQVAGRYQRLGSYSAPMFATLDLKFAHLDGFHVSGLVSAIRIVSATTRDDVSRSNSTSCELRGSSLYGLISIASTSDFRGLQFRCLNSSAIIVLLN